ncbi:MAG TPA: hypothetical protein VHK88_03390 [Aquihabitans sp.]|jgi:hypothetical protein|nr:hypothetical protein [Aquihabitans sp.]
MHTTTTTAIRPTDRRLRAGIAGLALAATFFALPGLAGAETPPAPQQPLDITSPVGGDDPTPDGPDGFGIPTPEDDCAPQISCDLTNPEPGEDECPPPLASCDLTDQEPEEECPPPLASCDLTDVPDVPDDEDPEVPGDTVPEVPEAEDTPEGTVPADTTPEPAADLEVAPAVADAPVQGTPTFTG